ncbi:MAG TPA: EAL domain-containing protein [Planctomycetota bacterium]|jgi:diguanylate cyclase (GGDEF)-like protein/PAS domain S-box-containing protein
MAALKTGSRKIKLKSKRQKPVRKKTSRVAVPKMGATLYRGLLDNLAQKSYCTDLAGRVVYANRQYCRDIGKPLNAIIGKTAYDFFPKELADKYSNDDQRVIHSGRVLDVQEIHRPKNKPAIYVRVIKAPLCNAKGQIVGVHGTYWDVTHERESAAQVTEQAYLLTTMLETLPDHVYFKDLQGRFLRVSRAEARDLGLSDPEQMIGKTDFDFFRPEEAERFRAEEQEIARTGKPLVNKEEPKTYPDGHYGWTTTTKMPVRDDTGRVTGIFGVSHDITPRKESEERLAQQNYFVSTLLATVPDYIFFKDMQSRFILTSHAHARLMGLTDPAQAVGKTDFDFFPKEQSEQFARDEQEIMRTGRSIIAQEEKAHAPNGSLVHLSTTKLPLRDSAGKIIGTLGVSRDITDRKRSEELLYRRAFYDPLTELPNRALFMDRLTHLFRRAQRHPEKSFAVLFLDLDRFKAVNDSLGHEAGDSLLIASAQRIEQCVRPGDTVARLGGDEFTVLLEEVRDVAEAVRVSERVLASLSQAVRIAGTEVFSTASIGIALSTSGYEKPEDILRDADTAMYGAKAHGKARYEVFDTSMHDRAVVLLESETSLRHALERNEFRVYYQPIVRLTDKKVLGFEALARWQHPKRGLLLPEQFIPIAEEVNLMGTIGLWVLREACRQTHQWHEQYPSDPLIRISVNISSKQLRERGFAQQVRWTLQSTGLDPKALTLEVTEQTLVEGLQGTAAMLAQLRELAVQVYIDNFGTGYSLMQHLSDYPVDMLKVDRSLVKKVGTDEVHEEVLRTIMHLAQSLGIKVSAQGVETQEQMDRLMELNCGSAQGFLFSQALDAQTAEKLLASGGVWNGSSQ